MGGDRLFARPSIASFLGSRHAVKLRLLLGCLAMVGLSSCWNSVVGDQCADGLSPCGGRCLPHGQCKGVDGGLDGQGLDGEGLDGASDEVSLDTEAIDEGVAMDGASLDSEGNDGSTSSPVDADRGEAIAYDAPNRADTSDGRTDIRLDDATVDTKKVDAPPDSPGDSNDSAADIRLIFREVGVRDTIDASDVPWSNETGPLLDLATESSLDTQDSHSYCDTCEDARDASTVDRADSALDADAAMPDVPPPVDMGIDTTGPVIDTAPRCPSGQTLCSDTCVDVTSDYHNCGLCGVACQDDLHCADSLCTACPSSTLACGGQCIDPQSNPANCGACSVVCPGGACRFGTCKATTAGHAIVLGHDFLSNGVDQNKLLANAVFLSPSNPLQLAHYYNSANASAIGHSITAINAEATARGRQVVRTAVSTSTILTQLTTADVFLISGQQLANDTALQQLGTNWTSLLSTFVHTGGIIVLLDANYPGNSGGVQILSQAGILALTRSSSASNNSCTVSNGSDALASGVAATYVCAANSTTFTGSDGSVVVTSAGQPVVVHKKF
jgi:hypothetical protein